MLNVACGSANSLVLVLGCAKTGCITCMSLLVATHLFAKEGYERFLKTDYNSLI